MKTLSEALDTVKNTGGAGSSLRKHLSAVGITEWSHFDREHLYEFKDHLEGAVAASTARTLMLTLKAFLRRYKDCVTLPDDWGEIASAKGDKPMRTYLTPEEINRFAGVQTNTPKEELVKIECLLEAYTGARISDIMTFTAENVHGDELSYVSQKTKVAATIPISPKVLRWINYAQSHRQDEPATPNRCMIIRKLCERAGIDAPTTVFSAGETKKGPKWKFVTSHTFRISFVTNLQQSGMDLVSISRLSGHRNVAMTERYCAPAQPKLNLAARLVLGLNDE